MNPNELMHYGVLGMKWGVRRTPAQLARARGERLPQSSSNQSSAKKTTTAKSSKSTQKKPSDMSDDELQRAVRRLQLEQQYRQLNPQQVSAGKKFANKVMKDVVVPAATEVARNALKAAMKKAVDKALKMDTGSDDKKDKNK